RFAEQTKQDAEPDPEQLNFCQRHLDIARDHQTLVEHPVQHVDEAGGTMMRRKLKGHARATITYSNTSELQDRSAFPRIVPHAGGQRHTATPRVSPLLKTSARTPRELRGRTQ